MVVLVSKARTLTEASLPFSATDSSYVVVKSLFQANLVSAIVKAVLLGFMFDIIVNIITQIIHSVLKIESD